jgi:hypothetical protein
VIIKIVRKCNYNLLKNKIVQLIQETLHLIADILNPLIIGNIGTKCYGSENVYIYIG